MKTNRFASHASQIRVTGVFLAIQLLLATSVTAQTYVSQWDADGVPLNLSDPVSISTETLQSINLVLPESQDTRILHPEFIATDDQLRVSLTDSANIYVTFIHEGAGFRNTFGCFLYDTENPPTSTEEITKEVLFPNTSYQGSGGGLQTGDTVFAGRHGPGTTMGFWMTANTWRPGSQSYVEGSWRHWSIRELNQETDINLRPHMVLLSEEGENLILGYEDVLRSEGWCDHDFNDVVFMVQVDPPEALVLTQITDLPGNGDSDGDGVQDYEDAFPDDNERAEVQYTPSVSTREIIAFEDKWPSIGDYDFNDLVVKYQVRESLDASGAVKEIRAYVDPVARGASYHNGFAIQLEVAASAVEEVSLFSGGIEVDASGVLEAGTGDRLVLKVFSDAHDVLPSPPGSDFANTESGSNSIDADQIELRVVFVDPIARAQIGLPPYNPFLFRTASRGHEIHLLDKLPSDQALTVYFGTSDDASDIENNQYYRNSSGFPWAMILPEDWLHPLEWRQISMGYSRFDDWVESSGESYSTWYSVERNLIYLWGP